jgi:hypothetical protein
MKLGRVYAKKGLIYSRYITARRPDVACDRAASEI